MARFDPEGHIRQMPHRRDQTRAIDVLLGLGTDISVVD